MRPPTLSSGVDDLHVADQAAEPRSSVVLHDSEGASSDVGEPQSEEGFPCSRHLLLAVDQGCIIEGPGEEVILVGLPRKGEGLLLPALAGR